MLKVINSFSILFVCFTLIILAQSSAGYRITQKIAVGGEGGWDYITCDAQSHRLFVSHGNKVVVISTDSDKVVGEIPKTEGVHGIAVANEFGRCFISNGRTSTVSIVDLKTLKLIDTVSVGKNPDAILYDLFLIVYLFLMDEAMMQRFLMLKKELSYQHYRLSGKPEFSATDSKGRIFVNIEDKNEIVTIDAKEMKILSRWSIKPGEEPSGLGNRRQAQSFIFCVRQ